MVTSNGRGQPSNNSTVYDRLGNAGRYVNLRPGPQGFGDVPEDWDLEEILGVPGLNQSYGTVQEELLTQLQGTRGVSVIREMVDNDPVIGSVLFAIEQLLRRVDWRTEPYDESAESIKQKNHIDQCFDDMSQSWEDTLAEIASFLPWGWCFLELCYKKRQGSEPESQTDPVTGLVTTPPASKFDDGLVGWRKWAIRAQETRTRWVFDEEGGVRALVQTSPIDNQEKTIPIEKGLLFRTTVRKNNPEGRSILRSAYLPWYYKKRISEIEAIGVERDLAGLPVAWVPPKILDPNASPTDRTLLTHIKKILANVKQNSQGSIVFPMVYDEHGHKLYDLTLMTSGGRRQFDTNTIIQRYDQRMATVVLADFIFFGHVQRGTQALSVDRTNLFTIALKAWIDMICGVINRHGIPRLIKLNGWDTRYAPTLTHGEIDEIDLDELGHYIERIVRAGYNVFPSPDGELEHHLLKAARLPAPAAEDILVHQEELRAQREEEQLRLQDQQEGDENDQKEVAKTRPVASAASAASAAASNLLPSVRAAHRDHDQSGHGNRYHLHPNEEVEINGKTYRVVDDGGRGDVQLQLVRRVPTTPKPTEEVVNV